MGAAFPEKPLRLRLSFKVPNNLAGKPQQLLARGKSQVVRNLAQQLDFEWLLA
jgi:hypothetical protein